MDEDKNPDFMPEMIKLPDDEFYKQSLKYLAERDVFAFSTILSLNYLSRKGKEQHKFLQQTIDYITRKA